MLPAAAAAALVTAAVSINPPGPPVTPALDGPAAAGWESLLVDLEQEPASRCLSRSVTHRDGNAADRYIRTGTSTGRGPASYTTRGVLSLWRFDARAGASARPETALMVNLLDLAQSVGTFTVRGLAEATFSPSVGAGREPAASQPAPGEGL